MADLRWLAPRDKAQSLQMFTKFSPMPGILDVQDPYGGTQQDYERALDLIEAGCKGLLTALTSEARAAIAK
jgi:protein-tyrosine phosphatase